MKAFLPPTPIRAMLVYFVLWGTMVLCHLSDALPKPLMAFNLTRDIETIKYSKDSHRRLTVTGGEANSAPLFEGLGTHYSFIWVGSPPQRVSVIMDTGSHHTAFPCVGCKCGKHMDPGYDHGKSSSANVRTCGGTKKCFFRQAYTEGSSWHAYKVKDTVWVGGPGKDDIPAAAKQSANFEFGCIDSETGLFRTQKVDGIMGLSAAPDTLPYQLKAQGVTNTKLFALCYRTGGGVATLGGVDVSLHADPKTLSPMALASNRTSDGQLLFAKLVKPSGWYTVRLLDVMMRENRKDGSSVPQSIGGAPSKYNSGKGTIVDSGTTDTYLPSSVKAAFQSMFKSLSGRAYTNTQMTFSQEQFAKLPVIIYRLQAAPGGGGGADKGTNGAPAAGGGGAGASAGASAGAGEYIDLEVFPHSYMERHRNGKYTPRVYLTEGSGTVLGANAMNEHNVIFDQERMRVGFARSQCTYASTTAITKHDFHTSVKPDPPGGKAPPKASKAKPPPKASAMKDKSKSKDKSTPSKDVTKGGVSDSVSSASNDTDSVPHVPFLPKKKVSKGTQALLDVARPALLEPFEVPSFLPNITQLASTSGVAALMSSAATGVVLAGEQKLLLVSAIRLFVAKRVPELRPQCGQQKELTVPCSAQCNTPFSAGGRIVEYLHADAQGRVVVSRATVVNGSQHWKVHSSCAQSTTAGTGTAAASDVVATTAATAASGSRFRRLEDAQGFRVEKDSCSIYCPVPVPADVSADVSPVALSTAVSTSGASASASQSGGSAVEEPAGSVHIHPQTRLDDSWSECHHASRVRTRLVLTGARLKVLLAAAQRQSKQAPTPALWLLENNSRCYYTAAATGALKAAGAGNNGTVNIRCEEVRAEVMPCAILHSYCSKAPEQDTSSYSTPTAADISAGTTIAVAATTVVAPAGSTLSLVPSVPTVAGSANAVAGGDSSFSVAPMPLLVSVYVRLEHPLRGDAVAQFQLGELETAFATLFNVPLSDVELTPADQSYLTSTIAFSFLSSTPLQLHMRVSAPERMLPQEVLQFTQAAAASIVSSSADTAGAGATGGAVAGLWSDPVRRKLLRSVLKEYVLTIVRHEDFPHVLAATMRAQAASDPTLSDQFQWYVPASAYFAGVSVREISDAEESGCDEPSVLWADYFGLTGSLSNSGLLAIFHEDGWAMRIAAWMYAHVLPLFGRPYSLWWFLSVGVLSAAAASASFTFAAMFFTVVLSSCLCSYNNEVPGGFRRMVDSTMPRHARAD